MRIMTEQEIKQNALAYRNHTKECGETIVEAYARQLAFEAGAHSRDDEVSQWKESYEKLAETSDKWIKCSEQLPKKRDEKIHSDVVLVTLGQCWTAAEYHFDDKRWINMLGEREIIEPEYWREVNLPREVLEKGE